MKNVCCQAKHMIEDKLFGKNLENSEKYKFNCPTWVNLWRMLGDCSRYQAEIEIGNLRTYLVLEALSAYEMGNKLAEEHLSVADPSRLGLTLHMSVCYYEMTDTPECGRDYLQMAYDSAQSAQSAQSTINSNSLKERILPEEEVKESNRILQIMENNLYLAAEKIAKIEAGGDGGIVEWKDLNARDM